MTKRQVVLYDMRVLPLILVHVFGPMFYSVGPAVPVQPASNCRSNHVVPETVCRCLCRSARSYPGDQSAWQRDGLLDSSQLC